MNKLYRMVMVTGLMLVLGVTRSWAQGPPDPTASDSFGNTAGGTDALISNIPDNSGDGQYNTAYGDLALGQNISGFGNTASGWGALHSNTTGGNNTAIGVSALENNTTGGFNTASGVKVLSGNTTGYANTAAGYQSLCTNTGGGANTASGTFALYSNTTGMANTAVGARALVSNATGNNNIALGYNAGSNLNGGGNNIDVGAEGATGDGRTMRLGKLGLQTRTFIAGVSGTALTGGDVVVNSSGQLGVVVSSARFKRDISDMGEASAGLMNLRPVTFRYKEDPAGTLQYGLVAEEVERLYPELVTYGADGKIESVRYSMLTGMLLNELQKQAHEMNEQSSENARQAEQIKGLSAQMVEVKAMVERSSALQQTTQAKDAGAKLAVFNQ